ncbi:hypothetical protein B0H66DRAFT_106277 [Apodospora peruviana]|uniref:Uncharacterized protein n=1 Tax=Apodospora peruviana TaxID=516989 RepID=A0AAE0MAD9_9PEZI|nr:hypothetical protein B0H66DRAFT_106277 [Apodospora peruviana]
MDGTSAYQTINLRWPAVCLVQPRQVTQPQPRAANHRTNMNLGNQPIQKDRILYAIRTRASNSKGTGSISCFAGRQIASSIHQVATIEHSRKNNGLPYPGRKEFVRALLIQRNWAHVNCFIDATNVDEEWVTVENLDLDEIAERSEEYIISRGVKENAGRDGVSDLLQRWRFEASREQKDKRMGEVKTRGGGAWLTRYMRAPDADGRVARCRSRQEETV